MFYCLSSSTFTAGVGETEKKVSKGHPYYVWMKQFSDPFLRGQTHRQTGFFDGEII